MVFFTALHWTKCSIIHSGIEKEHGQAECVYECLERLQKIIMNVVGKMSSNRGNLLKNFDI